MDALRRLSWTQSLRIKRPQTSQSSQMISSSTLSSSGSVKDLVHRFEDKQERTRRISSEATGPAPSHSRAASPVLETTKLEQMATRKMVKFEGDSILGCCLQLPALPKSLGGDFGRDLVERFVQSRLALAVDSAADDSDELPPIPDTPTGYARFGFTSRESFNTAVQDLVQENPDTPIGGKAAVPMKRSFNIGTRAINGSSAYLDAPQFDVSSPPTTLDNEGEDRLHARSNFSDSFHEASEIDFQQNVSPSSPAMVTAPQSPGASRRNEPTTFCVDGPSAGGTDVIDFAQPPSERRGSPPLPDCCVSPRSLVSDVCIFNNIDTSGAKENQRAAPYSALGPVAEFDLDKPNARGVAGMSVVSNGAGGTGVSYAQSVIINEVGLKGPNVPGFSEAQVGVEGVEIERPNAALDLPQGSELGVPMDGTGQLLPPGTPPMRGGRRKKVIRGGQKVIRKGRGLILKRPVLAVVVGRQLSGPTANALRLISKGVPVDVGDLAGAVRPPAPVPQGPA
ncbi:hypothetical protein N431DRAFT_392757 [Stipitochalara longipes BDJ]|nr:hypothetical protein N431DRAFT_392757 [Stipitochalara longipes BDJ]